MPDAPDISIIIVSYNTRAMTLDCLRTLGANCGTLTSEVFVVDNASADGSADAIRESFPHVTVIANSRNVGFGAANNQAMALAKGRYFLLLNSDAFIKPGALAALHQYLETHAAVGVVGPRLLNEDGSLQISCFRYPSPTRAWLENLWISSLLRSHPTIGDYRRWPHDSERKVDWVIGACLLVRREVYEKVGGFDERFFMYAEETDWQARIRDAGWTIGFTPTAEVTHLGGASGKDQPARINEHFFKSLDIYERKHHGIAGIFFLHLAMVVGGVLRFVLWGAVLVLRPGRRSVARMKAQMHLWLVWRQLTNWRVVS
jgi:GT2 family glycosyltransferase